MNQEATLCASAYVHLQKVAVTNRAQGMPSSCVCVRSVPPYQLQVSIEVGVNPVVHHVVPLAVEGLKVDASPPILRDTYVDKTYRTNWQVRSVCEVYSYCMYNTSKSNEVAISINYVWRKQQECSLFRQSWFELLGAVVDQSCLLSSHLPKEPSVQMFW